MTGKDNRTHLSARINGMAGCLACALAVFSPGLVLGQAGLVLPPQADRAVSEQTTLVVTNSAVGTNLPPPQSGTVVVTNRLSFSYADRNALLADGWSFMAKTGGTNRNTETTSGLMVDYDQVAHPGSINIPCDLGDLWEMNNNRVNPTRNFLSRALSPNWTNIDLTITFYADTDTQQAGIALYQDDDNFMWIGLGYSNDRGSHPPSDGTYAPSGTNPSRREFCVWEYDSRLAPSTQLNLPVVSPHVHGFDWIVYGGLTHKLRLSRPNPQPDLPWSDVYQGYSNPNIVSAYWSPYPDLSINPVSDIGDPGQLYGYNVPPKLVNPRIGIWTGCGRAATPGATTLVMNELVVISIEPAAAFHYSLINPPAGATIDANGVITWTPTEAQGPGTNVFTTVATYTSVPPLSATNSFTVVVAEVNTAPTLPPQPDRIVSVLTPLTVVNTATDTDIPINPLSYQLTVAPAGATISSVGVINWTPGADQQLTTNLFVTVVTDSNPQAVNAQSLSATNSFRVVVLPPPGPVLPIQAARSVVELTTLVITNTATDGDPTVPQIGTNTILFNYGDRAALLADDWSFIGTKGGNARDTEYTAGQGGIDYNQVAHPGILNVPCDQGDLLGTAYNNTRNSLFRSLLSDWQSVRLALTFAPVAADYQQAHLGLYQDDDNYVQMGVARNSWEGGERFTMDSEIGGITTTPAKVPTASTSLYFRLDRNPANSTVTNSYSFDGANWTVLGVTGLTLTNPRLMIWTGGLDGTAYANGMAVMSLRRLDIVAGTTVPTVLSYTLINPPAGATIDGNGIITWQPGATNAPGSTVFTTVVTDNGLPPLRATNSFTVTVVEPPKPPTIKSVTMSTGAVVITWDCAIGSTYRLQYKDDLGQTNWLDLLPDVVAAGHTITTTNDIGSSPSRFFRVLLLH